MAWSSFAHLPTSESEYQRILSQLKDGMSTKEVDHVIARCKGREKVSHHYRSNLVRLGLFDTFNGKIFLFYNPQALSNKETLILTLKSAINRRKPQEILYVHYLISKYKSYDSRFIAEILLEEHPYFDKQNLVRWVRPILTLIKILDNNICTEDHFQEIYKSAECLQNAFLVIAKNFENIAALEQIEHELKKEGRSYNISQTIDELLNDIHIRFKIELLMLPSWATDNKSYKIGQDIYTHIKIKSNLLVKGDLT